MQKEDLATFTFNGSWKTDSLCISEGFYYHEIY